MPGHTPGQRSYATLCGGRAGAPVPVGPGDVDCLSCLSAKPHLNAAGVRLPSVTATADTSRGTTRAATSHATIVATGRATVDATTTVDVGASWPTDRWLAVLGDHMPPLAGPAGTAERLLLLIHYGIDWQTGWVGRYRTTYWDQLLPDRIITATYRAASLRRWWRDVATELGSAPRNTAERAELEHHLRADPREVLEVLRFETEALLLRTRIVADAVRETRSTLHSSPERS